MQNHSLPFKRNKTNLVNKCCERVCVEDMVDGSVVGQDAPYKAAGRSHGLHPL